MLLTTTPGIEGTRVTGYLGIIAGEAIVGASAMRDTFSGVRDIVGGRSGALEEEVRRARGLALADLDQAATAVGAHAVVGVTIVCSTVGEGLLMVTASGTAVTLE
jgi:uncharacterized protein YbjQ (UPF0145 family)